MVNVLQVWGHDLITAPPPSSGAAVMLALHILQGKPLHKFDAPAPVTSCPIGVSLCLQNNTVLLDAMGLYHISVGAESLRSINATHSLDTTQQAGISAAVLPLPAMKGSDCLSSPQCRPLTKTIIHNVLEA